MSQCTFFQDNILKFENKFVSLQTEKTMNMTKDECIALLDAKEFLEEVEDEKNTRGQEPCALG